MAIANEKTKIHGYPKARLIPLCRLLLFASPARHEI